MVHHGLVLPVEFLVFICKGIFGVKWSGHHILRHCASSKSVGKGIILKVCIRKGLFITGQPHHSCGTQSYGQTYHFFLEDCYLFWLYQHFKCIELSTNKKIKPSVSLLKILQRACINCGFPDYRLRASRFCCCPLYASKIHKQSNFAFGLLSVYAA